MNVNSRKFKGEVLRVSGEKTIVVKVVFESIHKLYKKLVRKFKKFLVHDEQNKSKVGDLVSIVEVPKVSKRKYFSVVESKQAVNYDSDADKINLCR